MKKFEEHTWAVTFDSGSTRLTCLDPCGDDECYERDERGEIKFYCHCVGGSDLSEALSGEFVMTKGEFWSTKYGGYMDPPEYDWGVNVERLRAMKDKERDALHKSQAHAREGLDWDSPEDDGIDRAPPPLCLAQYPSSLIFDPQVRCVLPAGHEKIGRSVYEKHRWVKMSSGVVFTPLEANVYWAAPEWEKQASKVWCWKTAPARPHMMGNTHCLLAPGHEGDCEFFSVSFAGRWANASDDARALGILRDLVGMVAWGELEPILGWRTKSLLTEAAKLLRYGDPFERPKPQPLSLEKPDDQDPPADTASVRPVSVASF